MNYTNANKPPPSEASSYDGTIPPDDEQTQAEVATERVATLVGDNLKSTDLFCQMDILRTLKDELVWKEMARWVRYEEAVEEGGERWSKPHVASLMMEALQDLQHMLSTCPVFLECGAKKMTDIADEVIDAWREDNMFPENRRDHFYNILIRPHVFQFLTKKETKMRTYSSMNLQRLLNNDAYVNGGYENGGGDNMLSVPGTNGLGLTKSATCPDSPSLAMFAKTNKSFMRKIPAGSESVNLLVGEIDDLDKVIAAFVRLKDASNLGDITEVALDTRFMFIILAPKEHLGHCAEMCRCMGALFTDEIFRCVAYRAEARTDILAGIQEFCLHLTVLPPGVWDPTTRIEPPDELPSQDYRKTAQTAMPNVKSAVSLVSMGNASENEHQEEESHADPTLVRTGKLFGGLINDVKRKVPYYLSDFKDALHIQCLASFFFLFLATLTPNVTFGGLLGQATDQYMGTMECILSAAISGVMFALFSGQPLNILGSTGPMLVLEAILYRFCKDQDWDFLPFRVWVGFWTALMILLIVAFDLSALVRFITRFTEESFACLIALIFIYQAFKKTIEIEKDAHVQFNALHAGTPGCFCLFENKTFINMTEATALGNANFTSVANVTTAATNDTDDYMKVFNSSSVSFFKSCMFLGGTLEGAHCDDTYVPDVFFFSLILFAGTFMLSTALHEFRHSLFFPTWVRTNVSDFAVLISIVVMVLIDALIGIPTPKLMVPAEFKPTKPGRPWFINPISEKNPWWLMILSAVPALLATILIFMDQQITAVIVNRKENKLKKGSGYHLDMLVVGVLVVILSLLGLPWYVAATVTALAHIMSLKKVSECTAPGEKPVFLGVREQRVTGLMVGIFSGLAVLITSVLNYVPMPVLYGVFLYMGVAPLGGMQLVQRILLVFMPAKYQPDYSYIRNVPIRRVHLFTAIQVFCLAVLWVVKSIKSISIGFPLMVLIICFIRKAMDKVFTQRELKWLDDILPAISSKPEEVKAEPILIKVTDSSDDNRKETQATEAETNVDEVIKDSLKPRMSITFVCKTGVDRIKEMAPSTLADRRKSLIMAVERKRSLQMYDGHIGVNRKISSQSMFERKYSHGSYGPRSIVNSDSGQYSGQNSHQGSTSSIVEEHNRQNKMLSLPATIKDENENDSDS